MKSRKYGIWLFLLVFSAFLLIIISIASLVYYSQKQAIRNEKSGELSALFRLKVKQFLDWKQERVADAMFLKNNPDFVYHFEQFLKTPENTVFKENISRISNSIIRTGHYKSLFFINESDELVLSLPDTSKWKFSIILHKHELDSASATDEIIMTTLHFAPDSHLIMHLIVPLVRVISDENKCIGFFLLNIDPATEFYPLLQTFQIHSNTAEALLVRKESDQIEFLNELRHRKETALKMKLPLSTKNLAAAKALEGIEGIVDAVDYRNKKVLAAIGPVPGTVWYLVIKIDNTEIYRKVRKLAISTATTSFLILVIIFLLLRIIWLSKSSTYEKEKLILEYNYQLLNQQYSLVSKYANDAILLWDSNHILIDLNDKALELYGYSKDEMTKLTKEQLRPEEYRKELKKIISVLEYSDGTRYETVHLRKNGKIFPVEISTRCFTINDNVHYQSIVRDITERKNAENALMVSEEKFRYLFEHTGNCVAVYEAVDGGDDFVIKDFNKAAELTEKKNRNEILGKRVTEIFPGIEEFGLLEIFRKVWKTGIAIEWPAKLYKDDRITGWRENHVYKLQSNEIVAVFQDVSNEKIMLENLRENSERLRLALNAAKQGLYDLNVQEGTAIVSPEYETMIGYKPGELQETNKKWMERLHPDDRKKVYEVYEDYIAGKIDEYRVEFRQLAKTGNWIWTLSLGKIISYDKEGKPLRMLGTHTDITQRKTIEEALRKSELLLKETSRIAKIGGWEFDVDTLEGTWTEEVARIHEVDPDAETDVNLGLGFYQGKSRIKIEKAIQEAITYGTPYDLELEMKTAANNHKWIRSIGIPVVKDGRVVKVRGSFQDITELKNIQTEIKNLNVELEKRVKRRTAQLADKNRELETFTYSVSHDLKAPLRGIDGYSRLLLEEYSKALNVEAKQYLDNIRKSTLQMNQLIDDLLKYSRLERYTLRLVSVNINQILKTTINQVLNDDRDNKVSINIKVPDKEIIADTDGLSMALRNLIENAIKFTRKVDRPVIEIGFEEKEQFYIFYVSDNGIGFDMRYHNRIFKIFQRLHRVEDYPGTGIGLAMVTKAMERMEGRIWAESNPGMRTVFYLEIPKV